MKKTLGNLIYLDARSQFPNEPQSFTPWLAKDENISELARVLGIELEVENTQVAVGTYWADILAKDVSTGRYVVIENYIGKTDHKHLGQCITYASVLDASTVIWIATEFSEEHKKALDWLNDHTSEELSFYGVKLELIKIDKSKPAVQFKIESYPPTTFRQATLIKASEQLTDIKKLQLEFWNKFRDTLQRTQKVPSVRSARAQLWFDVSLGKTGIHLSNTVNTKDNVISVRVYICKKIANVALPQLMKMKKAIENDIGHKLEWNPNPENDDKIIVLRKRVDLSKNNNWDSYIKWMVEYTLKFRKAFVPKIKKIDFSEVED